MSSQDLSELVNRLFQCQSSIRHPIRRHTEHLLPGKLKPPFVAQLSEFVRRMSAILFNRVVTDLRVEELETARASVINRKLRVSLLESSSEKFIDSAHPFFDRCRATIEEMREIIGFTDQSVDNMFRLLRGNLLYPPLLLHNPKLAQDRHYRSMIDENDTLSWLELTLGELGLTLDDVVVFERFPLLAGETLLQLHPDQCRRIVEKSFAMSEDFLQTFSPEIVVSCYDDSPQLFTSGIQRIIADPFRSSIAGAEDGDVNRLSIERSGRDVSVIQAFHPSYAIRRLDHRREMMLKKLLGEVYEPCAKWKQLRAFEDLTQCLTTFHNSCSSLMKALEKATDAGVSIQMSLRTDLRMFGDR